MAGSSSSGMLKLVISLASLSGVDMITVTVQSFVVLSSAVTVYSTGDVKSCVPVLLIVAPSEILIIGIKLLTSVPEGTFREMVPSSELIMAGSSS